MVVRDTDSGEDEYSDKKHGSGVRTRHGESENSSFLRILPLSVSLVPMYAAVVFFQDYSMDCYFRQSWRDSRLSFLGPIKSLSLNIKMLERIWRPDTYIYNGKHSYVHTITVPNKLLRISQDGDILYSMRYRYFLQFHISTRLPCHS